MLFRFLIAAASSDVRRSAVAGDARAIPVLAPRSPDVDRLIDQAVGLPSLPTAPPANLAAPDPAAAAASSWRSRSPTPPQRTGKAVAPGAPRTLRVAVANRGSAPLTRITVTVRVDGARIDPAGGWRLDGALARAEVATLAPGGRASLPLTVRSAEVPSGGEATARVLVDARHSGQPPAAGEFSWTVRDCPAPTAPRCSRCAPARWPTTRQAVQAMRKGDPALPQGLRFMPPPASLPGCRGRAAAAGRRHRRQARRRSGAVAQPAGLHRRAHPPGARPVHEPARHPDAVHRRRRGGERLSQGVHASGEPPGTDPAPGRQGPAGAARATAAPLADLATRARRAAEDAQLLPPEAPDAGSPLATLAAARAALPPGARLDPAIAEALSAVEVEAWLTQAEAGADRVSRAFAATLDGILAAHAAKLHLCAIRSHLTPGRDEIRRFGPAVVKSTSSRLAGDVLALHIVISRRRTLLRR